MSVMSVRRARLFPASVAIVAAVALCAGVMVALPTTARAADKSNISVSPGQAKPGEAFTVSGSAPACSGQPLRLRQVYTDRDGSRIEQYSPSGGVVGADGSFHLPSAVPAAAARSNIFRPFGAWQWDTVVAEMPGCGGGTELATNLEVLAI